MQTVCIRMRRRVTRRLIRIQAVTLSHFFLQKLSESVKSKNEADEILRMRRIASGFELWVNGIAHLQLHVSD